MTIMGMYGPNDALGAAGYNTSGGCLSVVAILFVIGAGAGLLIVL